MVNNQFNVSAYHGRPPSGGESRKIAGGPIYQVDMVLKILGRGEDSASAWTRKCKQDLQKYSLDGQETVQLIKKALLQGRYRNSEWCEQRPSGPWAACDAYTLTKKEWISHAYKDFYVEYYIKFAISKTGMLILIVSCHLSEDRG